MFMLAGGVPEPFENWMGLHISKQMPICLFGRKYGTAPNVSPNAYMLYISKRAEFSGLARARYEKARSENGALCPLQARPGTMPVLGPQCQHGGMARTRPASMAGMGVTPLYKAGAATAPPPLKP
jgi:hypothetical protein